jgi:hypothetical protein
VRIVIMRRILRLPAPNTYYGQWLCVLPGESRRFWRAIARNEGQRATLSTAMEAKPSDAYTFASR